ncbi:MAG: C39 family peptidase [Ruthenibacterium sp.]
MQLKRPRILNALLCLVPLSFALLLSPETLPYLPENSIAELPVFAPILYTPDALPACVRLSVPSLFQLPELPNGCEGTSLAMVLRYFGYSADKVDIALHYVPRAPIAETFDGTSGPDPHLAYAGNPLEEERAYYCFAPPIAEAANLYLEKHGQKATAHDITGATKCMLMNCLCAGQPVILWATLGFRDPCLGEMQWTLPNGTLYTAYSNLHCIVLTGYDRDYFYVSDPLFGELTLEHSALLEQYAALGCNAVVLSLSRAEPPRADAARLV